MKGLTRFLRRGRHGVALAAAISAVASFPALASAADCDRNDQVNSDPHKALLDSGHNGWDLDTEGAVDDGYNTDTGRSDAFDTFGELYVSVDGGTTFNVYVNADKMGCTLEDGGREVRYPDDGATFPGLKLGRKVYVPASGLAFARWIDTLTNTSDESTTVIMRWGGNLGSDNTTTVVGTSSGDAQMSAGDSWVKTYESPLSVSADPLVTTVWDGTTQPRQRAVHADRFDIANSGYTGVSADSDYLGTEYDVTLAPGEAKRFMHIAALTLDLDGQAAATAAIAAEPDALRAGISEAEEASIQNWTFDADGDGIPGTTDNCPSDANPGQEDLDGDGKGNACDDDIDGDGLTNAIEAALRTDPAKADTDGDGKPDAADSCPTIAAATDDGCPLPVVLPQPTLADGTPPRASVAVVRASLSLKTLLRKGLTVRVSTDEPASVAFEIVAAAKGARLARVGDLVVAAKSLGVGSGKRTVTLKIGKKLRKAIKQRSKLTLRSVAIDVSGNRSTQATRLKLRK